MASEGTILTLGSVGGFLYRDTNWNRKCGTKVRLVLQKKEILLNNTVHKTFLTLFPGQILVLAGGIFRQKPVSESFLQYNDNGVLD